MPLRLFFDLLREAVDIYINNPIMTPAFHACSVYLVGEHLLQMPHDLHVEIRKEFKTNFLGFMNE